MSPVVGALIVLIAFGLAMAGLWALASGLRDEWRARRDVLRREEAELLDEIEEWLKQQQ